MNEPHTEIEITSVDANADNDRHARPPGVEPSRTPDISAAEQTSQGPAVRSCACAHHPDGSVSFTFLCPIHADVDPCLTMATVTGRRRKGSIRRGKCTACGHTRKGA